MVRKIAGAAILSLAVAAGAYGQACDLEWGSTDLEVGTVGPKKYFGDTNIAYAIFSFDSSPDIVYRIRGQFPDARYMSIESSKLLDIGSWDFDAIQDSEIVPDEGSENPFTIGVDLDTPFRSFTVDAVPEGSSSDSVNRLGIPADGVRTDIWLRIVSPNQGVKVTKDMLPVIQALDIITGEPIGCGNSSAGTLATNVLSPPISSDTGALDETLQGPLNGRDQAFGDSLLMGDLFDLTAIEAPEDLDLEAEVLAFIKQIVREKWWSFRFRVIDIPFEGSEGIPGYSYGLTKMMPGKVALVRFKAPSFLNTYAGDIDAFTPDTDVRYWSLCALDLERSQGLACLPDHLTTPDRNGFVNIVYGPAGEVEEKAKAMGYGFIPDQRTLEDGWDEKILTMVFRQLVPSESFSALGLHKGDYVPKARVCTAQQFMRGWCRIL